MTSRQATLDIDAGNTRIKWRLGELARLTCGAFVHDGISESLVALPDAAVARIRVANVAAIFQPEGIGPALQRRYGVAPIFAATSQSLGGVTCGYSDPKRFGIDRWLSIVAARQYTSRAFIVGGLGTAVTLDFVDASGRHFGGYIVPGLQSMAEALFRRTADVQVRFEAPQLLEPGSNTLDGVNRGVVSMLCDFIAAAVGRFEASSQSDLVELFLTGGDAGVVASHLQRPHRVVADLVLDGLAIAIP